MNSAQEQAAQSAVESLYAAVTNESLWPQALADIGRAFDSPRVAILRAAPRMDGMIEMRALNHDPAAQREYNEYYWALDPSQQITPQARVGQWLDRPELFDPASTPQPEYMDFAIRNGIRYVVGGKVHEDSTSVTMLGLQRPVDHKPFDAAGKALFARLSGHIGRATCLAAELRAAQISGALSMAAIDRMLSPVFAIGRAGKLLMANAAAEHLLRKGTPFVIRHQCVHARDANTLAQLTAAMERVARGCGSAFSVRQTQAVWLIRVVPLAQYSGAALVYASSPDAQAVHSDTLAQLLGFTPAEAEVAYLLADGWSAKEIAFARAVSINTVRAQIREILRKAGVRRQTDLAKLLFSIPRIAPQ